MIKLNEFGLAVWKHKYSKVLFAQRDYEWCDRIVVLDETKGRLVISDQKFSTFNFNDWIPMTQVEIDSVKESFKEIYD